MEIQDFQNFMTILVNLLLKDLEYNLGKTADELASHLDIIQGPISHYPLSSAIIGLAIAFLGLKFFWFNYDPEYQFDNIVKRYLGIFLYITGYSFLIYVLIFSKIITPKSNPQFLLYLSSATIQAYAALIFLPLTISIFHFSRTYPLLPLSKAIIKKGQEMIFIYIIILFISVFCILVNPFDKLNPDNESTISYLLILLQVSVALLPILILRSKLIDIFTLTPVKLLKIIGFKDQFVDIAERAGVSENSKTENKIINGLSLIRSCILDISLRDYLYETIELFVHELKYNIDYDKLGNFHSWLVIRELETYVVDPLQVTDKMPDLTSIKLFIKGCNLSFRHMPRDSLDPFKDYIEIVMRIIEIYAIKGGPEAYSALLEHNLWCYFPSSDSPKLIPIEPQIVVSRSLLLCKSLIYSKKFQLERKDKRKFMISTANMLPLLVYNPKTFCDLDYECYSFIVELIKECGPWVIAHLIFSLPFIENEIVTICDKRNGDVYIKSMGKIIDEIKNVMQLNEIRIYIPIGAVTLLTIHGELLHRGEGYVCTILQIRKEINYNKDLRIINSFVDKYFKDYLIEFDD